jgi:hypothetical protein
MIRPEDRLLLVEVAVEIFCARITANAGKHGYSPDMGMCVGEAAALINQTYAHLPNENRPEPTRSRPERRKSDAVELDYQDAER